MRRFTMVLAVLLQACSFAFVSGPPANHAQLPMFDCTSSKFAPVVDTIFGALELLNLGLAAKDDDTQWHDVYCHPGDTTCNAPLSRGAAIPLYVALVAVEGAAAYYGYTRVDQCKDAKAQLMQRQMAAPPTQGTWPPPGPGTWPPPAVAPAGPPGGPPPPPPPATAPAPSPPAQP